MNFSIFILLLDSVYIYSGAFFYIFFDSLRMEVYKITGLLVLSQLMLLNDVVGPSGIRLLRGLFVREPRDEQSTEISFNSTDVSLSLFVYTH